VKLVYSQEAVADLVRLRDFIANNNPTAAARVAADLVERIDGLCGFPEMGRNVSQAPEPDSIRDFIFGNYVVRYTVHGTALVILRIWHHYEKSSRGST
jgi:plasmid stabilization system protein ParE